MAGATPVPSCMVALVPVAAERVVAGPVSLQVPQLRLQLLLMA
jgi:hypothetical protein